jgi:hypothetical protein
MNLYEYVGGNPHVRIDPHGTAFVNEGRVGVSTLWWFGGIAGLGRQGIGTIQREIPPDIVVDRSWPGKVCATVRRGTGIADVIRGYTGTQAGDQGVGTVGSPHAGLRGYVSARLAAGLDAHEQGHVHASEQVFNQTLFIAEHRAKDYQTVRLCCCPTPRNPTGPDVVLRSKIAWDHWKSEFSRLDAAVNGVAGTFHAWEAGQGGGPRATPVPGVIATVHYDLIYRSREETEAGYRVPAYGNFVDQLRAQPPPREVECAGQTDSAIPNL